MYDSKDTYKKLNRIINKSPVIVFLWQNEKGWPVEFVSDNVTQIGYSPKEFLSKSISFSDIIHPDDLERVSREVDKFSKEKRENFIQEYRIITKEGKIKWVDDRTFVRFDKHGNITHYQGIILDITRRKESEEKFGLIREQSLVGVFILQDDKLKYVNEKYSKITGYSSEEVLNWNAKEFYQTIHPDSQTIVSQQAYKKQKGDKDVVVNYQFKGIKKSGEIFWAEIYSKSITYKGRYADLGILLDITDKKKAELKLKQSEKKYREAYQRENFYKDLFAHDMNNILHGISLSLEMSETLLQKIDEREDLEDIIGKINDQVNRGVKLINNVRKFSEITGNDIKLIKIDIIKKIQKAVMHLNKSFTNEKLQIDLEIPQKSLFVKANELIIDVFENILINSIQHNDNDVIKIKIILKETIDDGKRKLIIDFEDNGRGIPDENKLKIFKKSSFLKTKESSNGMGLGLFLVKKILESYNAEILVSDRIEGDYRKGTRFSIIFDKIEQL